MLFAALRTFAMISLGISLSAHAEEYPSRPIHLVVPYSPGGANDTFARLLGERLSEQMGQPVIIDNRPGAAGMIAGEFVSKAPPDGYTIMVDLSSVTINPALHPNISFDVRKDLSPIILAVNLQHIVVVNPSVPVHNISELVDLAKREPGKLNYSSPGGGTPQHVAIELFKKTAGIDIVHVAYKGGAPAMLAVIGQDAQVSLLAGSTGLPQIRAGKLRAIAVFGDRRLELLPDVPTMSEQGFPGFHSPWLGVFAPAKTPAPLVHRLHAEIAKALETPTLREKLEQQGFDVVAGTTESFAKLINDEVETYGKLIRDTGIKAD